MRRVGITVSIIGALMVVTLAVPQVASAQPDSAMQAQMMEKWMKYMTPGPEHKELAKLSGNWNAKVKMWQGPGAPAEESAGKSTFSMIMGGRYLKMEFEGEYQGQVFHGMGLTAFDNFKKEFTDIWIDDMSTGMMVSHGAIDENGHCRMKGTSIDFMTDRTEVPTRSDAYWVDDNTHVFKMWSTTPDGAEYQVMEITYTRAK